MELLIVIAIIVILGILLIVLLNPLQQICKANDAKRKHDLSVLNKVFEDYYNDKGCYPKPSDVCYDVLPSPLNVCTSSHGNIISQVCHICGNDSNSPSALNSYLTKLPCDPDQPAKKYTYEVESKSGMACHDAGDATSTCPSWYRVYSQLCNREDQDSGALGCGGGGCGLDIFTLPVAVLTPYPYGFDYGVSSPNKTVNRSSAYYCYNADIPIRKCNTCGATYDICTANTHCPETTKIYGSKEACCGANPSSPGCN